MFTPMARTRARLGRQAGNRSEINRVRSEYIRLVREGVDSKTAARIAQGEVAPGEVKEAMQTAANKRAAEAHRKARERMLQQPDEQAAAGKPGPRVDKRIEAQQRRQERMAALRQQRLEAQERARAGRDKSKAAGPKQQPKSLQERAKQPPPHTPGPKTVATAGAQIPSLNWSPGDPIPAGAENANWPDVLNIAEHLVGKGKVQNRKHAERLIVEAREGGGYTTGKQVTLQPPEQPDAAPRRATLDTGESE